MKKVKTLIILSLFANAFFGLAQTAYTFDYMDEENSEVISIHIKQHPLGEEIATQMQLMSESYTYQVTDAISGNISNEIEKPSILSSVNKVNRHVKKAVKKGNMTKEEGVEVMKTVLRIALNIRHQNTEELEAELWTISAPAELMDLFTKRITMEVY